MSGLGISIGEIAELIPAIEKEVPVSKLEQIFDETSLDGIAVVEKGRPVGLVMKNKLYYRLGTNYGVSLYQNRPVALIMDKSPLIVDSGMPIEEVSQIAMSREGNNIYDLIIVVNEEQYAGMVSIMSLLNNITSIQISHAHNSNPLTGLPGNLVIECRLKNLLKDNKDFAVLYIDLDNFKAFNDKYGFERGDKAILMTVEIIRESLANSGCSDGFLGHIGGDDFIIITRSVVARVISENIIGSFNKGIQTLYNSEDISRGFIEVINRRGEIEQFPVMSVSIAVVTNSTRGYSNYLEIGEVAAELKKVAKRSQGSSVVYDRRQF